MKPRKTSKGKQRVLFLDARLDLETIRQVLNQAGWQLAEIDPETAEVVPPPDLALDRKQPPAKKR